MWSRDKKCDYISLVNIWEESKPQKPHIRSAPCLNPPSSEAICHTATDKQSSSEHRHLVALPLCHHKNTRGHYSTFLPTVPTLTIADEITYSHTGRRWCFLRSLFSNSHCSNNSHSILYFFVVCISWSFKWTPEHFTLASEGPGDSYITVLIASLSVFDH